MALKSISIVFRGASAGLCVFLTGCSETGVRSLPEPEEEFGDLGTQDEGKWDSSLVPHDPAEEEPASSAE